MFFDQTIKNIKRAREVIQILMKYGFEEVVTNTSLQKLIPQKRRESWTRQEQPVLEYSRWERIRMAVEELGPTFVKGAQVLSNRPDILPEKLIEEFQKLQSDVPPFPFEQVQEIVEAEMGQKLTEIFEFFDQKTLGSASIGQVHQARLIGGKEVVVKIQRPGVDEIVETDISIIKTMVDRGEGFFERKGISNPMDVVVAFEKTMQKELNYLTEARNIIQFKNLFDGHPDFYVPKVYRDYSTGKILVLEMVKGCKITDVKQLKKWGLDIPEFAEKGIKIYLHQIFEHGFFHADPHPGNIIIGKDGRLNLIDFGMVGRLMKKDRFAFASVFIAMAQQNPVSMANNLRQLAIEDEVSDERALQNDLNEIIQDFSMLDVKESNMAILTTRLQKLVYDYRMRVPGDVFLILRALAILEGIGKTIHPNFNISEFVKPFGQKMLKDQLSVENALEEIFSRGYNVGSFLDAFPVEIRDILVKIRKGRLKLEIHHHGYEPLLEKIDFVINRISLTLIIAALLISSSIIMHSSSIGGAPGNIPWLSFIGFILAGGIGVLLLINILRSDKY